MKNQTAWASTSENKTSWTPSTKSLVPWLNTTKLPTLFTGTVKGYVQWQSCVTEVGVSYIYDKAGFTYNMSGRTFNYIHQINENRLNYLVATAWSTT